MNTQPMRLLFVRMAAVKERLKPHLAPGNVDNTMAAPVNIDATLEFLCVRSSSRPIRLTLGAL